MYTPKYSISNKILRNIGAIEGAREVIENAPLVPAYEKQFKTDALARTLHHGTHIEGVGLSSVDQVKKVLEGEEVIAHPRDIQEVINYRNVMELVNELSVKRGGYTVDMLTDIHKFTVDKIIAPEKVGVFRKTQVVIKEESSGKVVFQPPPFVEVPYLVEDFIEWLNSEEANDFHPVIKAGIAHYVLVAIHPFVEGNGRTVRAFATIILLREGFDINRFFSLEEHFDNDLSSYYQAFSTVDRQSPNIAARDLTTWLEYFSEVVAVELTKIKDKVKKLSIDSRLRVKVGEQISLSERQVKLFEYLTEKGDASMQDLKKVIPMVSEDTVLRDLRVLVDKRIIKKEGSTKAARYVIART